MTEQLKEGDVVRLLEERYAGNDWVLIPQVPDGTGAAKSRTADAVAMSLWPSRGLELHGFEVKVSRSDWLKEINGSGQKSDAIAKYCDRWWAVVTAGNAKVEEVPKGWGLMLVNQAGTGITVKKPAPELTPKPIDRAFLAGLLRASNRYFEAINTPDAHKSALSAQWRLGYEEGRKAETKRPGTDWHAEFDKIAKALLEFEAASGIRISQYTDGKELGELVKRARTLDGRQLRQAADNIRRQANTLSQVAEQLQPPPPPTAEHGRMNENEN